MGEDSSEKRSTPERKRLSINDVEEAFQKFEESFRNYKEIFERYKIENADRTAWFDDMEAKFTSLPERQTPNLFQVGQNIKFPLSENNPQLVDWKVLKAEKGYYLIERPSVVLQGKFDYAFFDEAKIAQFNSPE